MLKKHKATIYAIVLFALLIAFQSIFHHYWIIRRETTVGDFSIKMLIDRNLGENAGDGMDKIITIKNNRTNSQIELNYETTRQSVVSFYIDTFSSPQTISIGDAYFDYRNRYDYKTLINWAQFF